MRIFNRHSSNSKRLWAFFVANSVESFEFSSGQSFENLIICIVNFSFNMGLVISSNKIIRGVHCKKEKFKLIISLPEMGWVES